ncbi:VOC family protein [Nocardiopsis exhalans]|uniref:VOC family protein n=1 Tax=Nocardiopsis exhalans TaxID=163604 RepID=A0ABY5D4M9_9ACTN|nr:VOC family protein [Nocardiopsis exhalans]USY17810.1 VOC family protein [Nocardiopsis exhalans]
MTMLHHLALTTSRMAESRRFYDAVLLPLGYERGSCNDKLSTWHGPHPEILLFEVEGEDSSPHTLGRPGWHHASFSVTERESVLRVHEAVASSGWTVVHKPREYPEYSEGYFAVFVEDPDGIRIEVAHIPVAP